MGSKQKGERIESGEPRDAVTVISVSMYAAGCVHGPGVERAFVIDCVPELDMSLVRIVAIGATGSDIQASPRNVRSYQQLRFKMGGFPIGIVPIHNFLS